MSGGAGKKTKTKCDSLLETAAQIQLCKEILIFQMSRFMCEEILLPK